MNQSDVNQADVNQADVNQSDVNPSDVGQTSYLHRAMHLATEKGDIQYDPEL